MKLTLVRALTLSLILFLISACESEPGNAPTPTNIVMTPSAPTPSPTGNSQGSSPSRDASSGNNPSTSETPYAGSYDDRLGEGLAITFPVTSDAAAIEIIGCPPYDNRTSPYVYGRLTQGVPADYELMVTIVVDYNDFGLKPFHEFPNARINSDGTFRVQFSSNDGRGRDWESTSIFIYLVESGYEHSINPNVESGWIIPPSQIAQLMADSVCVVEIKREPVTENAQ